MYVFISRAWFLKRWCCVGCWVVLARAAAGANDVGGGSFASSNRPSNRAREEAAAAARVGGGGDVNAYRWQWQHLDELNLSLEAFAPNGTVRCVWN